MRTARWIPLTFVCAVIGVGGHGCTAVTPTAVTLIIDVSFADIADCTTAGVDSLRVSAPSGDLTTTVTACTPAESPFVTISSLPVGTYTIEVDGLQGGVVLYSATQTIKVPVGGTTVAMNLALVADGLTVNFIFGAPTATSPSDQGMDCFEAGVQSVSISVDGASALVMPCQDPASMQDLAIVYTSQGPHTFQFNAFASTDGSGTALYSATNTSVMVAAANMTQFTANMKGLVNGGLELTWVFDVGGADGGNSTGSCTDAMVTNLTFNITDATGAALAGLPTMPTSCASPGHFDVAATPGIAPGVYFLTSATATSTSSTPVMYSVEEVRMYVPAGQQFPFTATLSPM